MHYVCREFEGGRAMPKPSTFFAPLLLVLAVVPVRASTHVHLPGTHCWGNPPACSGYPGAGYTATPIIQAVGQPPDMRQMYPGVPGSGLKPAGFSDEVSILYQ
jgi:hypothetical protein